MLEKMILFPKLGCINMDFAAESRWQSSLLFSHDEQAKWRLVQMESESVTAARGHLAEVNGFTACCSADAFILKILF